MRRITQTTSPPVPTPARAGDVVGVGVGTPATRTKPITSPTPTTPTTTSTPAPAPTASTSSTPPTPPAAPRPVRGRRTEAEQTLIRERIEQLMYQNLRSPAIHRALTGPEAPNPIVISERQVRAHMAAVESSWAERASRERLETEHAKAIAVAEETARTAAARSALNARSNVGVGYLNASLKAQDLVARLRGLHAPTRTELAGPDGAALLVSVALADHPAEHLDPREEARRLRQMAADREAEAEEKEASS